MFGRIRAGFNRLRLPRSLRRGDAVDSRVGEGVLLFRMTGESMGDSKNYLPGERSALFLFLSAGIPGALIENAGELVAREYGWHSIELHETQFFESSAALDEALGQATQFNGLFAQVRAQGSLLVIAKAQNSPLC